MKRMQKFTAVVLSCAMAFTSAFTLPKTALADAAPATGGKYIREVKIGYGEEAKDAEKALEGYTILKNDAGKYADLNEGASSKNFVMRKGTAVVYLGYKTTDDPSEAITDLATMNMKGGYSFAQYEELMEELRDRQIRPFVDRFLAAIREYRENYHSENEANRAKAVYIHDMLNCFTDVVLEGEGITVDGEEVSSVGFPMGDWLLELTKEEGGDGADLTEIFMKGNGSVVLMIEQLLVNAADTAENTWLDRFLAYGPDGLLNSYLDQGMEPSEAEAAMAAEYEDTARMAAQKWEALRADLLSVQASEMGQELAAAEADGTAEEAGEAEEDDVFEDDFSDILEVEASEEMEEKIASIPDGDDVNDIVEREIRSGEIQVELAEDNEENQLSLLYIFLHITPYGDGTLLDFFLKPVDEVSGDNLSALYPLAASLSEGQKAGLEFLSLEQLLRLGNTDNRAYEYAADAVSEILDSMPSMSVYHDVNLELFGDGVALTSEALRKDPALSDNVLNDNTLGISTTTMIFGGAALLSTVPFAFTLKNALHKTVTTVTTVTTTAISENTISQLKRVTTVMKNQAEFASWIKSSNSFKSTSTFLTSGVKDGKTILNIKTVSSLQGPKTVTTIIKKTGEQYTEFSLDTVNRANVVDRTLYEETVELDDIVTFKNEEGDKLLDEIKDMTEGKTKEVSTTSTKLSTSWGKTIMAGVFGVIMVGLSAYTIYRTYNEMYAYYHQEMTPIPKYIVDEKNIVTYGSDGTKTIHVNEKAYYKAADMAKLVMEDGKEVIEERTGDLNGDVAKQWLALYYLKGLTAPVLADSLKVVTGTDVIPDGYQNGIHMIGSGAVENLTNPHYTYNDDMNGIYVYYKTDATAIGVGSTDGASATEASAFSDSRLLLSGTAGAAIGALLSGLVFTIRGKRKEQEA